MFQDEQDSTPLSDQPPRTRKSSRPSAGQTVTPVLSAEYLNKHSSKNDLVRRLRTVVEHLSDEAVEPDSPDYPGLAGLAAALVENCYLKHKDKEVRLHTVLACVEIFYMYAPEPPYDEHEILLIFPQIIQQLANLATCTSPTHPNYSSYYRLLHQLSQVKIGVILVEMTKTLPSSSQQQDTNDDDGNSSYSFSRNGHGGMQPTSEDALEVLRELVEVLLDCVHMDHSQDIVHLAADAIAACVEEFDGGVPIPILDEILKCIGTGSVAQVTNPDFIKASAVLAHVKKKKKGKEDVKLPNRFVVQTNPSYMVGKRVIVKTLDRISTPIANLLNGLLDGDANVIKDSDIVCDAPIERSHKGSVLDAFGGDHPDGEEKEQDGCSEAAVDVWTIVYELHKIAPGILTTVIGTVASSLKHSDFNKRFRSTRLLGRLFYSKTSDIAVSFHLCYKEWIRRSLDKNQKIREVMVRHLLAILRNKSATTNVCEEATDALVRMVTHDPQLDIRLKCIAGICELVYDGPSSSSSDSPTPPFISSKLLRAVGDRVMSKTKKERLDSITGLVKIYNRNYILPKIKDVERGGEDCSIVIILDIIRSSCDLSIYESDDECKPLHGQKKGRRKHSSSPVGVDRSSDLEEEMYSFIPELLFQCFSIPDSADPALRNRILTLLDDVILGTETYHKGEDGNKTIKKSMSPTSRAVALTMIINHLQSQHNNEITANKDNTVYQWLLRALSKREILQRKLRLYLEAKTHYDNLPKESEERMEANTSAFQKLETLAKLTSPPSANSSQGSTDDLIGVLQKFHTAKDRHIFRLLASVSSPSHSSEARIRAFDDLPKRAQSIGTSASQWLFYLARRSAMGYFLNHEVVETCILLAQEAFNEGEFQSCRALLQSAYTAFKIFPTISEKSFDYLVELFSECRGSSDTKEKKLIKQYGILTTLSNMMSLTAQSRNSPTKISDSMSGSSIVDDEVQAQLVNLCVKDGSIEQSRNAIATLASLFENDPKKREQVFKPIVENLTSSSRLTLLSGKNANTKIVNVLEILTALVERVPSLFPYTSGIKGHGSKVIRFTLEYVLLGRGHRSSIDGPDDVPEDDNIEVSRPSDGRKSQSKAKRNRKSDETSQTISLACQRVQVAINFLVTHIRSTILASNSSMGKENLSSIKEKCSLPPDDHIAAIFDLLIGILVEDGAPPSSFDREECIEEEEKASLRKCATVNVMRLCDSQLGLEKKFFTHSMWHILSTSFLDRHELVREAAMHELSFMLNSEGAYGLQCRMLPSLRFLAYIVFCPDSDTNNSNANGNAANVGLRGKLTKEAALKCTMKLRNTCEATLLRCRAHSRDAEMNFEKFLKVQMMPEYAVHYAIHLLACRSETPSEGLKKEEVESLDNDRILRKRLTWIFDPLVKSLGESADNISFLLRLVDMLSRRYTPKVALLESELDSKQKASSITDPVILQSKLKVVCTAARDILMKYVKKDVHLTPYPGAIQIPAALFVGNIKSPIVTKSISKERIDTSESFQNSPAKTTVTDSGGKSATIDDSNGIALVQSHSDTNLSTSEKDLRNLHLVISPILKQTSPEAVTGNNRKAGRKGKKQRVSFGSPESVEYLDASASSGDKRRHSQSSFESHEMSPSSVDSVKRRRMSRRDSDKDIEVTRKSSNKKVIPNKKRQVGPKAMRKNRRKSDVVSHEGSSDSDDENFNFDDGEIDQVTEKAKARGSHETKRPIQKRTSRVKLGNVSNRDMSSSPFSTSSRSTRSTTSTNSAVSSNDISPKVKKVPVRRSSRLSRD